MSASGIGTSLFSEIADSPAAANQLTKDLDQLQQDLQNGNLVAAQQDYVTLSQDALNATSSAPAPADGFTPSLISDIASSPASASAFVTGLNQLGTDLANGNLSSAQGDMLSLDSVALSSVPLASVTASVVTPATSSNSIEIPMLVQATTEAMEAGDQAAVVADLAQLAAVSTSSQGATYLQSASANYGSSAGSSNSSLGSLAQLLQGLNPNSFSNSGSSLNLFA